MKIADRKESPILGLTGMGGGLASYILYSSGGSGSGTYEISRSLRFRESQTAYLSKQFATSGNRRLWTWAAWIKRTIMGSEDNCFCNGDSGGSTDANIRFNTDDTFKFTPGGGSEIATLAKFRDPSAWYHFICVYDSANSTTTDRMRIYVNGKRVTELAASPTYPTENLQSSINIGSSSVNHWLGRQVHNTANLFDGYMADVHFLDGVAVTETNGIADELGEFDTYGVWNPKEYTGSHGSTGFHLKFSDTSSTAAIGTDSTDNSNDWTPTNMYAVVGPANYAAGISVPEGGSFYAERPPWDAFDGDTSTFCLPANTSTSIRWTIDNSWGLSGAVEIYPSGAGMTVTFNDGRSSVTANANSWTEVSSSVDFDWINIYQGSGLRGNLAGVRVGGTVLINSSSYKLDNVLDTPSNYTATSGNNGGNYATLNGINRDVAVLADGNLKYESEANDHHCVSSTLAVSSGKWYWEYEILSSGTYHYAGIADIHSNFAGNWCGSNSGWSIAVNTSGNICWNNTETYGSVGTAAASGQIWGWALDLDSATPTLKLYIDGVAQYSGNSIIPSATSLAGRTIAPAAGHSQHKHLRFNFGQQGFIYTPPTGHKALCTQNLPTPTIEKPSEYVGVSTWTGTDTNAANNITGLGFSPDLIWSKSTSHAYNHQLVDRIRGGNKSIRSNDATEEVTDEQYGYINTFNSDGFTSTPGSGDNDLYNGIGKTYVAWTWNAGANSNRTYNVKVVSDSGNKYRFNDHGTSAVTLDLEEGSTYVFDSSDSSVDSHPFVLGTSANSNEYSTGVTYTLDGVEKTYSQYTSGFSAATTRKLTITVPSGAPTLYYWCSVHSGMGGQINTGSGGSTILSNSLTSSAYNTSATWSSSAGTGVSDPANIFDGSLSTGGAISSSGTARTITTSSFSARRIRFYKNGNNEGVTYAGIEVDSTVTEYALPFRTIATGWVEIDLGSTVTVTSLTLKWAPGAFTLYAIEVDGAILTDSTVTPPTTPSKNAIVRGNSTAGFSIIKYVTSNGDSLANANFGTDLGGPPEMVLMKTLYDGGQGWTVYHKDIPDPLQNYLFLDGSNFYTDSNVDTFSTSHYTFGCRGSRNVAGNDRDIIVYAWRSIPGYSKIGSWDSNGSADGNFIYLGFKPRWVMVKAVDDEGDVNYASWLILDTERDTYNVADASLFANRDEEEGTRGNGSGTAGTYLDILSNGFKIRYSGTEVAGANSQTFAYMAFAEHPFRTSRSR